MRVALVSTHRSDRGHYAPLKKLLLADKRFEVAYGDWAPVHNGVPFDVGVVLGDRYEMLERAMQFVEARIPLLHIHGGEHTYGSLDERWRYAITAIADWHCVANDIAKTEVERYLITGEWGAGPRKGFTDVYRRTANNVVVTGAPGLDGITDRQPPPKVWQIVVAYNPAIDADTTICESHAIAEAVKDFPSVLWVEPNGDRYSNNVEWGMTSVTSLAPELYRDILAAAHVIVGNSSAGIIEAPSLGCWTVNVGERQAGRPRAASILDLKPDATVIRRAIEHMLAQPRHTHPNPYGDGHASGRIRDVLLGMR